MYKSRSMGGKVMPVLTMLILLGRHNQSHQTNIMRDNIKEIMRERYEMTEIR